MDGAIGPQGDPGTDGTSCTVTAVGGGAEISCDDNTQAFVADGATGANGSTGPAGPAGDSCSVMQNANGSATITCEGGTTATISPEGGSSGPSPVSTVGDGYEVTVDDANLLFEGGALILPATPPDGMILRIAIPNGDGVTLNGRDNKVMGLATSAEAAGTTYALPTADPMLLTLLYVESTSTWYANQL